MTQIPRTPLILGFAGLLPFIFGMIASTQDQEFGAVILSGYGLIILCFMSGVLWGFAVQSKLDWAYIASVIPAIYAFFAIILTPSTWNLPALIVGFAAVFLLDVLFTQKGLTPSWWIPLRTLLTCGVITCLLIGYFLMHRLI